MTLDLKSLSVQFRGDPTLFPPISLTVQPGEVGTIMGRSGIGKSTLLDAVGGHLAHGFSASGQVLLNGRDLDCIPPEDRKIGFLFQDAVLFPHLSVGDNLAFGLGPRLRGRQARQQAVAQALEQAGLAGMERRDPATLSGGQRARVALMRSLLAEPLAILLDEPFSKLDAGLRAEMRAFTFSHLQERAIPALMVTHDPLDADAATGPLIQLETTP
jgi:putative thiamine transport system ATP-binding protein